jgi:hypothetical protein
MQDQFILRAKSAQPPLYPSRAAETAPRPATPDLNPQPKELTRDMLRDIIIEQLG